MLFEHHVVDEASGRSIRARAQFAGEDVVIVVVGGTRPHVGTIVLAQPCRSRSRPDAWRASCSVLTVPFHREEAVARPIAEAVCTATGRTTVVTAGIHDDDLDADGIAVYLDLARRMAAELPARLS